MRYAQKVQDLSKFETKIEYILGDLSRTYMGLFGQTTEN